MLKTIKEIYENGKVTLSGSPPVHSRTEVTVTFPDEKPQTLQKRKAGVLSGKVWMSDDFDEPLDDLNEYIK